MWHNPSGNLDQGQGHAYRSIIDRQALEKRVDVLENELALLTTKVGQIISYLRSRGWHNAP